MLSGDVLLLLSCCSFMALSVAIVGPRLLRGAQLANPASENAPLGNGLSLQQLVLHDLLAQADFLLAVQFAPGDGAELDTLVLWMTDHRGPGQINLSEVLVVRFSPLLRSVIAYTWSPLPDQDPILSDVDLPMLRRLEELASRPDAVRAVIAQPVLSCTVTGVHAAQSARSDASDGPLALRLTWLDESTDTRDVGMIRTELHLRDRSKRF